jgi:hypothetical protein
MYWETELGILGNGVFLGILGDGLGSYGATNFEFSKSILAFSAS